MSLIVDALNTTHDTGQGYYLGPQLEELVIQAGGWAELSEHANLYRFPTGGTLRAATTRQRYCISISGKALTAIRTAEMYMPLLNLLQHHEPKVTRLHLAKDYTEAAPPVLREIYERATKGRLRIGRTTTKAGHLTKVQGPALYDPAITETGTVYVGKYGQRQLAVYDKRQETMAAGGPDPGNWLRYELRLTSRESPSLRDALLPEPIFYHYLSPGVLRRPPGVPPWEKSDWNLGPPEPMQALTPAQKLKRIVETNPVIRQVKELTDQIGPEGIPYLNRILTALRPLDN